MRNINQISRRGPTQQNLDLNAGHRFKFSFRGQVALLVCSTHHDFDQAKFRTTTQAGHIREELQRPGACLAHDVAEFLRRVGVALLELNPDIGPAYTDELDGLRCRPLQTYHQVLVRH
ncbi:hypothetical protein D9M71_786660 [compost metagenome]